MAPWRTLFASLLLLACGPSVAPTTSTGSGGGSASETTASTGASASSTTDAADSSTTDATPPPFCACRMPAAEGECEDVARSSCDGDDLCATVLVRCAHTDIYYPCDGTMTYDEEALACALVALRDRTAGLLRIDAESDECGLEGCAHSLIEIALADDGRVQVQSCGQSPIGGASSHARAGTLAPPEHFTACLELGEPADRYACMFAGITADARVCE
ncbi:MAG TPA: hypothetical protein VG755_38485 [Nannocystaceae bacterium]|nr:hypothetical protein [Nannocystaceae bacterium]